MEIADLRRLFRLVQEIQLFCDLHRTNPVDRTFPAFANVLQSETPASFQHQAIPSFYAEVDMLHVTTLCMRVPRTTEGLVCQLCCDANPPFETLHSAELGPVLTETLTVCHRN